MKTKIKKSIFLKTLGFFIVVFGVTGLLTHCVASVVQEGDKTYIEDMRGERWDVTQAKSIGFDPERFRFGVGRNAFSPLDDSHLSDDTSLVSEGLRVLGVAEGLEARAYSIPKLRHHETANSEIGSKKIVVGY